MSADASPQEAVNDALNQVAEAPVEQKVVPPPVDPVVKRVETYFSKVNPPEKAFVEMFKLPRE